MARYWINQPSTLQPCHDMHGQKVLAPEVLKGDSVTVYFLDYNSPTISAIVPVSVLSKYNS